MRMAFLTKIIDLVSVEKKYCIPVFCITLMTVLQTFAIGQSDSPFYWSLGGNIISLFLMVILFFSEATSFSFKGNLEIIFCVFFYWFFEYINSFGHAKLLSIFPSLTLILFCCCSSHVKALSYKMFRTLIILGAFGGLIAVLLFFRDVSPLSIEEYYTDSQTAVYYNYGVSYIVKQYFEFRLCSWFNEPGLFGTFCALILASDNFKIKISNVIVAIAGILTFSVAFFILVFIGLIVKFLFFGDTKSRIAILIVLFIAIGGIVYLANFDDNFIHIVERFSFEDGKLVADTRTHGSMEAVWNRVVNDPNALWFGYDQYLVPDGSSSYKSLIIKHGITGCIVIFMPLILNLMKKVRFRKEFFLLFICFIMSIYQRPQVFNLGYFTILIGGFYYNIINSNNSNININININENTSSRRLLSV